MSKREYCGLFGIYNHEEAARLSYFGPLLHAAPGTGVRGYRNLGRHEDSRTARHGTRSDIFNERHLSKELKGNIAIGHVRYSTTGASLIRNAQPFIVRFKGMHLAIAHNGNLVNTLELREELERDGHIFKPPWTRKCSCISLPSS